MRFRALSQSSFKGESQMPTMVEAQRSHRHDEPKPQPKPASPQSNEPAPESARNALQQSMERRW
jgi:hypothetical protein